ncbi:MAG: hypothetical protein K8M05_06630 [Deltaproteobacteria bacterium]|nr:hypothetical protein [Kofleriaceae bacterium]
MAGASRMMAAFALVAGLVAPVAPVAADEPPPLRVGRTYSERIADSLTLLGESIDGHLGQLTLDSVKLEIDGRARRAHLRLAGETRYLSMTIQSDVHFRSGAAAVDAVIDLRVAGRGLRLELPDFEVMPRSYLGEKYVELRLPILRGTF